MVISTNLGYLGSWIGSHFQKEKKISSWTVYVLHKTGIYALLRRSRAETAKKCTKKYAARAYYTYCFLDVLVAVAVVGSSGLEAVLK